MRAVTADVGCKYCHHWREPPRVYCDCLRGNPECMNKISAEQIIHEVEQALSEV